MLPGAGGRGDEGSGAVDFVLVSVLVLALFLAVVQVGLVLHARNVLVAAAAEGARYGANADRTDADGAARALQVARESLPGAVAESATAASVPAPGAPGSLLVDVTLTARLSVLFLPVEPVRLTVHGHAVDEAR